MLTVGNNLIFGILLNMGTVYMMNMHFEEAMHCFEEAFEINPNNSILFYRWSQLYSYDEIASIEKLDQAKDLIKKAMECYSREKIFKEQGRMVLKMLNLHNVAEAYEYQRNFVDSQLRHKQTEETSAITGNVK